MNRGIPEGYVECSRCKMMTKAAVCRCGMRLKDEVACEAPAEKPTRRPAGPNKTEAAAMRMFPGTFLFEGRTFPICGGAKYTPDWVDLEAAVAIEVKAEFIHSRDSRRRFDEAKHLFPQWTWIWARKRDKGAKGKRWEVEIYEKSC